MSSISSSNFLYIRDNTGNIQYSLDNVYWVPITSWPVTIINVTQSNILKVLFMTDLELTGNLQYFICGSNNIQFGNETLNNNGNRIIINIKNVSGYPGFIQNGTSLASGNDFIKIYNIGVLSTNSQQSSGSGWVAQTYFTGTSNYIVNCYSNGIISNNCGGIVGSFSIGTFVIGCYSTGNGSTFSSIGGIVGSNSLNITCKWCFSTGNGDSGGGIIGANSYNPTALNCYSTGNLSGRGGIIGEYSTNSYATNCYSNGRISQSLGIGGAGIIGKNSTNSYAINCYSSGTISGGAGIGNNITQTNCYAANGSWNSTTANTALTNIPSPITGSVWVNIGVNQPYELFNMGSTPYTPNVINTTTNELINIYTQSILQGESTISALPFYSTEGYTFNILAINGVSPSGSSITINQTNGQITTTSETPPGIYSIIVRNSKNPYAITTFELIILGQDIPTSNLIELLIPPCCQPNIPQKNPQLTNYSEENIATKKSGKAISRSVDDLYTGVITKMRTAYSQPVFKSYYDYIQFLQSKTK
jgi:hypothetical protein